MKLKPFIRATVRNSVDPRYTYTVVSTPKGWISYQRNYGIKPDVILKVETVRAANLSSV